MTMRELTTIQNDEDYIRELVGQLTLSRDILRALIGPRHSILCDLGLRTEPNGLVHKGEQLLDRPFPTRPNPRRN